jgi:8-oxo-dGTP pyrophosphatase MutT (NUDIX family)
MGHVKDPPIRQAASAICVREGGGGPEVLVVERSLESRFLPGYVAFPGGAVEDADAEHAKRWFGSGDEAPRAAAVRELLEEVGLVLSAGGLGPPEGRDPFARVHAAPPSTGQLTEMAHWIAPPTVPVRFDARYFAVSSEGRVEPIPDGVEASDAWWIAPRQLLAEWEREERKLYWPTFVTVRHLAACRSADDVLALRFETREPNDDEIASLPRSVMEQD